MKRRIIAIWILMLLLSYPIGSSLHGAMDRMVGQLDSPSVYQDMNIVFAGLIFCLASIVCIAFLISFAKRKN